MAENTTTPMTTLVVDGKLYEIVDANARQNKQDTLISGTNIKTINGSSILGSGNLTIDCGTPLTIVLDKDDWVNKVQSVAVSGMDAEKNVFVGPTLASSEDYAAAGVLCTTQGAGSLTFTCETVPTTDLNVNLLIL